MKKMTLIILLLAFGIWAKAQKNEGEVTFKRTTSWTKMNDQMTFLSKQQKEKNAYMFGNIDISTQTYTLFFSPKGSKYEEKEENTNGYSWRKEQFVIYRDFENETLTDVIDFLGKTYVVEDSLERPQWKILNDIKDVAGHICMKAQIKDPIKNQVIVAWFAQDIKAKAGPERLWGLPGLILELDINNGACVISASKIEFKKLTTELDLPKKIKGSKIKEVGYQQMIEKHVKEKFKEEVNPFWSIRY